MGEEEVGQVPLVQAQLLVHWEVCPPLVKLLEEDHGVLGEAKLLKELRPVSEAKGHVQSILGQGQEGSHVLVL